MRPDGQDRETTKELLARLDAERKSRDELHARGLREYSCRVWTEDVKGDVETWRLGIGQVFFQHDLVPGVLAQATTVDPSHPRVVIQMEVHARTGQDALDLVRLWLDRCVHQDGTLTIRRVELFPWNDEGDRL